MEGRLNLRARKKEVVERDWFLDSLVSSRGNEDAESGVETDGSQSSAGRAWQAWQKEALP